MRSLFSRRAFVRLVSFFCAVSLVLAGAALVNGHRLRELQRQTQTGRQRALSELCENLDEITVSLQKSLYTNSSPLLAQMQQTLSTGAACAKVSLSQLTSEQTLTDEVYKFLSQVGDFTRALGKKMQQGKQLSAEEREALQALYTYAASLSDGLRNVRSGFDDGAVLFDAAPSTLQLSDEAAPATFDTSWNDTEQALADYPTLLYDGPFSDTVLNRKALAVEDKDEITRQTARERAAKWLGCRQTLLLEDSDVDGALALYAFSKGDKSIGVTKRGGLLAYVTNPTFSGEAQISAQTAVKIAGKYLDGLGYTQMEESYYSTYDGVCTIVFHYVEDDVTYYADLIKVSVALDTAQPVALDARGYLMNHTARRLPTAKLTAEEAAALLAPGLRLLHVKTALIPLDDGTEQLCYEFHCRDAGKQEVLAYLNVRTGEEADLQLLTYADGGILAR